MRTLALRAHKKGLELACHIPATVPDTLIGDPGRLRQVLVNLIGNAIKFTEQGEVIIHVEPEWQTQTEVFFHFTVSDTGIGIPSAKQQIIFHPFIQADSSTTRQFGGTGLGLAISSQLVEMMGGRIWVESEVGKGSTFHFTARFGVHHDVPSQPLVERESLSNLAVLVVDDNATNRRILEEQLTGWGLRPTIVDSGQAALEALHRAADVGEPFALVLLDAHMPHMDGFTVAEHITQSPALLKATIMMLTSGGHPRDAARCRELGISSYLTKPIKQSDLLNAIVTVLRAAPVVRGPAPLQPPTVTKTSRPLHILLVEDNRTNQRLATLMLEKWGYTVVVANSGGEALAALSRESFALVLMDVQMPEMDGFATTAVIRQQEQVTGAHVPIVALTAHAMTGDRERCLAAGMDAYLSKPLQTQELFAVIDSVIPATTHGSQKFVQIERSSGSPFDQNAILARVEGDHELLKEIVGLFFEETPELLSIIRQSIVRNDGKALTQAAHSLKGVVSSFGAHTTRDAARRLEEVGHDEDWHRAEPACRELERELAQLTQALDELRGKPAP
ncbi:MAG: response regulator [Candidatus Binatia bacterium]